MNKNTTIVLYSASNYLELFYLCKVLDFGIADGNMVDDYNHLIPKGSKYIKCQYYQKKKNIVLEFIINCFQRFYMYCPHKCYLLWWIWMKIIFLRWMSTNDYAIAYKFKKIIWKIFPIFPSLYLIIIVCCISFIFQVFLFLTYSSVFPVQQIF